ncbi:death-associated inhibitor of apoptosis 1-like [Diachasmimorpha longicaudata]|uniref:death-associated inhibitor of apoptosis 1-like n=1 Tax=Diachasmimorpha longicaudata TaxID=58733 RepID=UPI0030B8B6E7
MMDCIGHRRDTLIRDNLTPLKSSDNLRLQGQCPSPPTVNNQNQVDETDNIDYRLEAARLASYRNWPATFMDTSKLAAAGFYYTGETDRVKCFECGIEIFQWVEGDNPMSDHRRWRSTCKFIRKQPCGNVPIGVDPNTVPVPPPRSRDVCGRYGEDYRPNTSPDFRSGPTEFQFPSTARLGSLGLAKPKGPTHPEFASHDARLRTFDNWPKSMPQTKEELADAGFYYTGRGDETQCYMCGGGLKDWEPKDTPWEQHAKWFSKCYYVLLIKGQAFIDSVNGQCVPPPTREETLQMDLPSFIEKVKPPPQAEAEGKGEAEGEAAKEPASGIASSSRPNSPPKSKNADDARMCKICYNEELGVVFLPCRHMVACVKCAPGMTSCAVCREPVTMTVRAIIS